MNTTATVMPGLHLGDEVLRTRVQQGLVRVEALLTRELTNEFSFVTEASGHLMAAGGKRFRPLFTLLAAGIGPRTDSDEVVTAAAVVELIHLATLYHDDVMDEAQVRRGAASANARWDNSIAILAGDFLFARASRLVATLGPEAVRIIADTFAELVTGQIRETVGPADGQDPIAHHLAVLTEKTASLIDTCARYGGMFSGASPAQIASLRRYGRSLGIVFQISDDLLDISSDTSGKTPGTDLREGVRTLPMLYTLADPAADPELVELLAGPIADEMLLQRALTLLRSSAGMERTRATLAEYVAAAHAELASLPDSATVAAMGALVDSVVDRTR